MKKPRHLSLKVTALGQRECPKVLNSERATFEGFPFSVTMPRPLSFAHVSPTPKGLRLTIPRSKTDTAGEGAERPRAGVARLAADRGDRRRAGFPPGYPMGYSREQAPTSGCRAPDPCSTRCGCRHQGLPPGVGDAARYAGGLRHQSLPGRCAGRRDHGSHEAPLRCEATCGALNLVAQVRPGSSISDAIGLRHLRGDEPRADGHHCRRMPPSEDDACAGAGGNSRPHAGEHDPCREYDAQDPAHHWFPLHGWAGGATTRATTVNAGG